MTIGSYFLAKETNPEWSEFKIIVGIAFGVGFYYMLYVNSKEYEENLRKHNEANEEWKNRYKKKEEN